MGSERGADAAEDLVARAHPRSRSHQSRKVSFGGTGRSRIAVQPRSGPGSRRSMRPSRDSGRPPRAPPAARPRSGGGGEHAGQRRHRQPLAGSGRLVLAHDAPAQVHEHGRDVDLDRADLVAGAAQRRGPRQRRRLVAARAAAASGSRRSARDSRARRRGRRRARRPGRRSGTPSSGCSAARGARPRRRATSVRPPSSRTRWNSCGPSPGRHPGPQRRVRVHPLAGRGARQQLQHRPRGRRQRGSTFSMPITVISVRGSVVHMRPLPSDSTTPIVPVSATAKFAPLIADRAREELLAQVPPRRLGERRRLVAQVLVPGRSCARTARGSRRGCGGSPAPGCATGVSSAELDDQLGEVGLLARGCPAASSASLSPISSVASDLTLIDLVGAWSRARARRRSRWPRRRRAPSARCRRPRSPTPRAARAARRRWRSARSLIAAPGVAQRLPVGHLGDDPRALGADRRRRLAAGCGAAGRRPASRALPRGKPSLTRPARYWRGSRPGASRARRRAARERRRRCASGTSCRRPCRPRRACRARARSLSESIAIDVSAFLIANVPPKPQHSSPSRSSTRSIPRTARSSRSGASPTCSSRSEWHVGW